MKKKLDPERMTLAANRRRFASLVDNNLIEWGARRTEREPYEYEIDTVYGVLRIDVDLDDTSIPSIFTRFDEPGRVKSIDANPYSGKWNFHWYADDSWRAAYVGFCLELGNILPDPIDTSANSVL
jgi:hypothetical protein